MQTLGATTCACTHPSCPHTHHAHTPILPTHSSCPHTHPIHTLIMPTHPSCPRLHTPILATHAHTHPGHACMLSTHCFCRLQRYFKFRDVLPNHEGVAVGGGKRVFNSMGVTKHDLAEVHHAACCMVVLHGAWRWVWHGHGAAWCGMGMDMVRHGHGHGARWRMVHGAAWAWRCMLLPGAAGAAGCIALHGAWCCMALHGTAWCLASRAKMIHCALPSG